MITLDDYDAVVFDCDGVLLDSNDMKVEAFREVARRAGFHSEILDSFSRWQSRNFGLSRYRVFERLIAGEFGEVPPDVTLANLLQLYAVEVVAGYGAVAETEGARDLIASLRKKPLYVVSGSDEIELREVMEERGFGSFFREIYGSPATKAENLMRVMDALPEGSRAVFIGDAEADVDAAQSVGLGFIFMAKHSLVLEEMLVRAHQDEFGKVDTLRDLLPTSAGTAIAQ